MKILIVEPFYTESHKTWLDGLVIHSSHEIMTLTLPGFHWKWRMHGAAITLAKQYKLLHFKPDLVICTDMLDLATFISILRVELTRTPVAIYFHENQLSYPWSPSDPDVQLKRDRHYAFINYTSSLVADYVFFNSHYHKDSFIAGLGQFLSAFPDFKNLETVKEIERKSAVLALGIDLSRFNRYMNEEVNDKPVILWNHRWEYDKNPETFFKVLFQCQEEGLKFELIVLGKNYRNSPIIFQQAKEKLGNEIIHWGYAEKWKDYASLVCKSDILLVTSHQDFFGISVVEAIYCGVLPILPNRLAYVEHIHEKDNFYDGADELYAKLKAMIQQHPSKSKIDL